MLRNEALEDITDGKKYGINDMVKAGTGGCAGCSKCCETMADTIVLSPYDIWNLEIGTGNSFDRMVDKIIELKVHDGIILPNMKSNNGICVMLSAGRCIVHKNRPDFCRLFPLGRLYEGDRFTYVLQTNQCDKAPVKVKVKKWIDTPDYDYYADYIVKWHGIIREVAKIAADPSADKEMSRKMLTTLLTLFYQQSYKGKDFFYEFDRRTAVFSETFLNTSQDKA